MPRSLALTAAAHRKRYVASASTAVLACLGAGATASSGPPEPRVVDCHRYGATTVFRDADVFVLRARQDGHTRYYGCLSKRGKTFRIHLAAGAADEPAVMMGDGSWLGFPERRGNGDTRAAAINLSSGRLHATRAIPRSDGRVRALVVSRHGALAWIATGGGKRQLRMRSISQAGSSLVHSGAEIGDFLSVEDDRCVIAWRLGNEQRMTSLPCGSS